MNYEDMSDFEINKRVAEACGERLDKNPLISRYHPRYSEAAVRLWYNQAVRDYCNNPSDAWPIIFENGIDIEFPADGFAGYASIHGKAAYCFHDKKGEALRAAMIVYLMMQESEQ